MGPHSGHSLAQIHIWTGFSNLFLQFWLVFDSSLQGLDSNVHCQVDSKTARVFPSISYSSLSKGHHISPHAVIMSTHLCCWARTEHITPAAATLV